MFSDLFVLRRQSRWPENYEERKITTHFEDCYRLIKFNLLSDIGIDVVIGNY